MVKWSGQFINDRESPHVATHYCAVRGPHGGHHGLAGLGPRRQLRGKTQISIGFGDSKELAEAGRRYGNFTEHVPLALVLMAIVELNGANGVFLHIVGALLVLSRIAHPLGLHYDQHQPPVAHASALVAACC